MTKSQKSKSIVFIADFFKHSINGGAESNDSVLISHLEEQGYDVKKVESRRVQVSDFVSNPAFYIVGNFIGLSEEVKNTMASCHIEYVIYEHDHKYLKSRDPSRFKNFKAPQEQIINHDFYKSARAVVVLSEVCKEVICKNLNINNVYSIGCSLWTEERLEFLKSISKTKKETNYAILGSSNAIKGTIAATAWCQKRDIQPVIIGNPNEKEFLRSLAKIRRLVFIPQVLETFSRLAAEAKMLNCSLTTKPKLLGFASEECYKMSGDDLNDEIKRRVDAALALFCNFVSSDKVPVQHRTDITAVLNCYKRPHLLEEQVNALRNQSVPPKEIFVWVNEPEDDVDYKQVEKLKNLENVKVFNCNHNWKFYGRFAAAMLVDTEYVAMFDDDTIPGKDWLSNCLQTMKTKPGILGGVGVVLAGDRYVGHQRVGWSAPNKETTEVDLVGHAWFFKRDWLQHLWREKPQTWENGEDIQFSYLAQKYGGIKTFVPPHPKDKPEMFSSLKGMEYGVDDVATSNQRNHQVFYEQRNDCVKNAVKNGWKLVKDRKEKT